MAQEIVIEIDDEGGVEVKTHGFKGKACIHASQFIEEALGKIANVKKTGEYYAEQLTERVRVKNGD